MEVDGVASTFQDDSLKVVVQDAPCTAAPCGKSMDVAKEKVLQALVEEELQPQGATIRERQDKGGETAAGASDGNFAEVRPVGLRLFAGEGAQARKGLAALRAQGRHDAAKLTDAAG